MRSKIIPVLATYSKARNLIIVDSDSISTFIFQRSVELLLPDHQFNWKIVASIRDFQNDLRTGNDCNLLKKADWVIIDSKYLWHDQAILIDVLQFIRTNGPHIRRVLTAEFFTGSIFTIMLDENLIDEVIVKPIGPESLRNLVSRTH